MKPDILCFARAGSERLLAVRSRGNFSENAETLCLQAFWQVDAGAGANVHRVYECGQRLRLCWCSAMSN